MDRVAERMLAGDAVDRAAWRAVLARANEIAYERDERLAGLIASALWG